MLIELLNNSPHHPGMLQYQEVNETNNQNKPALSDEKRASKKRRLFPVLALLLVIGIIVSIVYVYTNIQTKLKI